MIRTSTDSIVSAKVFEIGNLVGNTPLLPIRGVFKKKNVKIYTKLEWQQMGMSVKARPAYGIINHAVSTGLLHKGNALLDATSGNTGIAYAAISAAAGLKTTLCLPKNASEERKTLLKAFGVDIIYTSPFDGTDGAQLKAKELAKQYPEKYYYADQYANENNWLAHYKTTAVEILQQTQHEITHFVAGLGTTGTFCGTTTRLKEHNQDIKAIALHPDSPMHGLEGWKHMETAIVPKIYDKNLADVNLSIDSEKAVSLIKEIAEKEGYLVSPSAAANLLGAMQVAEAIESGVIVTVFPDDATKYGEVIKQIYA